MLIQHHQIDIRIVVKYYEIDLTKDIGTCLMTGIITDTGGFRHVGITPETFEFTADLIRLGVDVPDIYKRTLNTKTRANFELSKRVMDRMELLEDGKVTFTYMNKQDEEEVGAEPGDHEGLVEIGRDIEGVEVSIFIRQKKMKMHIKFLCVQEIKLMFLIFVSCLVVEDTQELQVL